MPLPSPARSLAIIITASLPLVSASPALTDDSQCGCYVTNGSEVGYFTSHKFFDFRNLGQYQGVPSPITDKNASALASPTSSYFTTDSWTQMWDIQSWNNSGGARSDATTLMVNSPNNVYIEQSADASSGAQTWLTLRTTKLPGFQTAAEIASKAQGFEFLSMRMLARTIGASGGCTAMFTYRQSPDLATVQEADLEVRTRDPRNTIQYTNQPSYTKNGDTVDDATVNATLPNGLDWTNWTIHRLDWTPKQSTWYVDGQKVAAISFQAPRDASYIILNSWSDGGQWTGNMSLNDAAYLQIQWFEVVYNATDKSKRDGVGDGSLSRLGRLLRRDSSQATCKAVCSVDETSKTGQPVMLWNNGASTLLGRTSAAIWAPLLVTVILLLPSFTL